jgi:uncharacterized protein
MKAPRIAGIDLAYAVSLFAVIAFSMAIVLTESTSNMSGIHFDVLRDSFAAIYLFLNGLTLSFITQASGKSMSSMTPFLVKRGLFFTLTGFIISLFWPIDILITLGICTMACPLLFLINSGFLRFLVLATGVFSLIIGSFTDLILTTEAIDLSKSFSDIIIDSVLFVLLSGYYSIFPWALFFLLGVMYSRHDFLSKQNATRSGFWALFAIAIGVGVELITFEFFTPISSLQNTNVVPFAFMLPVYLPGFLFIAYGLCIICLNTCVWLNHQLQKWKALHTLRQIGSMKHSLYYFHFLVGGIAMFYMDAIEIEDKRLIAFLVTGYFVLCIVFTVLWKMKYRLGPIEWVLERITTKNAKP